LSYQSYSYLKIKKIPLNINFFTNCSIYVFKTDLYNTFCHELEIEAIDCMSFSLMPIET